MLPNPLASLNFRSSFFELLMQLLDSESTKTLISYVIRLILRHYSL